MPSTVVHVSVAFLIAVGLLGKYYDRRALGLILLILLFPETDTLAGWVLDGAHRALFHSLVLAAAVGVVLYWDTTGEESWLRERIGPDGVRVLWVGLFVHVFAHLALDWAHLDGINVFYPLSDRFFRIEGEMYLSTADGFVQTFIEVATNPETGQQSIDAGQGGTTKNTHVSSPVDPSSAPEPQQVDRRAPIAVQGWQLYLIVAGAFTLVAKQLQSSPRSEPNDE
ncbi:MAG: inner membrane protein [Natronomonas sp.]|jgi:inner membrane protein|uniref:metal-dependent hydrolase n=1 Tax=Natronomonas sp. TaxID=2184060 RepID=UPI003989625A